MRRTLAAIVVAAALRAPAGAGSLDDPVFRIGFRAGAPLAALTEAVQQGLARRPGLRRYAGFVVRHELGNRTVVLPDGFVGTIEQLVKSVACLNGISYRDFSPTGVMFVRADIEHPVPTCPQETPALEMPELMRRPIPEIRPRAAECGRDPHTVRQARRNRKAGRTATRDGRG